MGKKILSVVLVLATLFTIMPLTAYAAVGDNQYNESENNNGTENAKVIYHDYTIVGDVYNYDIDTFAFYVSSTSVVTFIAICDNSYMYASFMDYYDEDIISVTRPYYDDGSYYMVLQETLPSGWYYVQLLNSERYMYNEYLFYLTIEPTSSGHTHNYYISEEEAPTCTGQGYRMYECSCGDSYVEYVSAAGHNYSRYAYPYDEYSHKKYCTGTTYTSCSAYITEDHRDVNSDGMCDACSAYDVYFPLEGWHEIEMGKWAFFVAGEMATNCWKKAPEGWCYLGADGYRVTNKWMKDSQGWCYLGADGFCVTNCWKQDSKGWCYVGADGYAVTNCWKRDSVGWCYLDANGSMTKSAWVYDGGYWYYINANGYMVTGRQTIGGKVYNFNSSGVWVG